MIKKIHVRQTHHSYPELFLLLQLLHAINSRGNFKYLNVQVYYRVKLFHIRVWYCEILY